MSDLIKVNDLDVMDAHGDVAEQEKYNKERAELVGKTDPKTGKLLRPWTFEDVPGFFAQSDDKTDDSSFDFLNQHLGLVLPSWQELKTKLDQLNEQAKPNEEYKLVFFGRHGQGYHNRAVAIVGVAEWDKKWSQMTDGTLPNGEKLVWGPDPRLTDLGEKQAGAVHKALLGEIPRGLPLPTAYFSSPFTRSAQTLCISWKGISVCEDGQENTLIGGKRYRPLVKEDLRETIGEHTCDQRGTKSKFLANFGKLGFDIEPGFPEEDVFFRLDWREPLSHQAMRADSFLQDLFEHYPKDEVVYTASHAGEIKAFVVATGHRRFTVPTAGLIPMVIKGTRHT